MKKETEAFQGYQVRKASQDCLGYQALQALEEIWEAVGILEDQDQSACQEAWGTWVCQALKGKKELWDFRVYLEDQAFQGLMVPEEIKGSKVIQKVQGQDHRDQRANQDCRASKERKEKEARLGHLDNRGLLDLTEPLGVLGVLATQGSRVLMVIWVLKE